MDGQLAIGEELHNGLMGGGTNWAQFEMWTGFVDILLWHKNWRWNAKMEEKLLALAFSHSPSKLAQSKFPWGREFWGFARLK
jgi:hypothetical protein